MTIIGDDINIIKNNRFIILKNKSFINRISCKKFNKEKLKNKIIFFIQKIAKEAFTQSNWIRV